MLLECQHCGAPLDVSKNEPLTRCKYCGTISRAKALRTIADETPPDFKPPQQWTPPANATADSARTLVYHASWAIGRLIKTVVTIAVLLTVLPIAATVLIPLIIAATSGPEIKDALQMAQGAMQLAEKQLASAQAQAGAAPAFTGADLLTSDGAAGVAEQFAKRLGTHRIKALRLVLHPDHAVLDAQDPQKPAHVDSYHFINGAIQTPQPLNVQSLRARLEKKLFELDSVQLDRMSDMTKKALDVLKYEEARPTHVIVERGYNGKVVVRVYVSGPRESGRVEFDGDGTVQKTYR